jgi:threonine synthase
MLPIALTTVPIDLSRRQWGVNSTVLLWDETRNPAGCHKYPGARAVVRHVPAACRGVTVGTCGSYGLAVAIAAAERGLVTTVFIPRKAPFALPADLAGYQVTVRREGESYEDTVALSKAWAGRRTDIADVNVDGPFGALLVDSVANRTAQALIDPRTAGAVDFWVPTGNGTTVAGIGLGSAGRPVTRLFAVTSQHNNSIAHSHGRRAPHRPISPSSIRETPANVALCNWNALNGEAALGAIRRSGGEVYEVDDEYLVRAAGELSRLGVDASPSGAAGLAGLLRRRPSSAGSHIVLITGRSAL